MLNKKIPTIKVPSITDFDILGLDEKIISCKEAGFVVCSQYYFQGVAGAAPDCYLRESVLKKLIEAQKLLPEGMKFKIWDGYRPIVIQQRLWNFYRQDVKNKYPELSDEEIDFKTSFFVSKPSYDVKKPSLHNTGGAVDLTIIDSNGNELDMGTAFDDFSDRAWSNHFEEYEENIIARDNRRILYNAMINAGFTNLPSEWWHYDYGTKFWGYFTNQTALYEGILNIKLPHQMPLM